ncbi:hypothetical protein Tco_0393977 [Tanacetum coccineum]
MAYSPLLDKSIASDRRGLGFVGSCNGLIDDYLELGVAGEWLCVVHHYCESPVVDVWVMKVYGVKDSWTKLASIPYPDHWWGVIWDPLCISKDGKLLPLFADNYGDDEDQGESCFPMWFLFPVRMRVDSLVSFYIYGYAIEENLQGPKTIEPDKRRRPGRKESKEERHDKEKEEE